jgi:alpha-tubulin suppressor-like RCC1 family protein
MSSNYQFTESGVVYSFDDVFIPADRFREGNLWTWGGWGFGELGTNDTTNRSTPVTTFAGGTNWKQVDAGKYHTAAIKTDGTLWTWGSNIEGQLGIDQGNVERLTPVTTFAGGTNWKQVSAGIEYTAAVKTDGTLWTWGYNQYGNLGINDTTDRSTPVTTFAGGTNWKQVSAGYFHTAAVKTDGTLWTWGQNSNGYLGTNDTTNRSTPVTTFVGGTNWKQASAGAQSTAAIKTDGTLWTWGYSGTGSLGTGISYQYAYTPVTTILGGTNWKQVSSAKFSADVRAAIKTDGTLWTWGGGFDQYTNVRLGRILNDKVFTPVTTFSGGTNWADTATGAAEELYTIDSGLYHTTAIKTDGTLWVWGLNNTVYLGTNDLSNKIVPVTTFAGGTNWKQVSAENRTAAIKTDGTLWVWGYNPNGILGTNDAIYRSTPVTTFAGGTNWKQVSVGSLHTAAIKTDGTLWVWGYNNSGQLGTNDSGSNAETARSTPVTTFAGGTNWKQVSVGGNHTAAIKTDGTLWTWGDGSGLGNNGYVSRSTPVTTFAGGTNWKQVSAGGSHTAAIKTDGTLWTWGAGFYGRLGTNDTNNIYTPVTTFAGGTNWKQVSIGKQGFHTAAVKTDGTLWTWGYNRLGQLGTNNTIARSTPVTTFAGGTNWKQVSVGRFHTIALQDDGVNKRLYTWGYNSFGQLGLNIPTADYPGEIYNGGNNWKQVSAELVCSSAIKTDGTLWVWGENIVGVGVLGINDDTTNKSTPVTTFAGGTNWKQVCIGANHMAAILQPPDPVI